MPPIVLKANNVPTEPGWYVLKPGRLFPHEHFVGVSWEPSSPDPYSPQELVAFGTGKMFRDGARISQLSLLPDALWSDRIEVVVEP